MLQQLVECKQKSVESRNKKNEKLSYRRETARQLPTWRGLVSKVSKCRFVKRDYVRTPNALTVQMSGEQVRLQVPLKLYRVHSWITQIIRQ